MATSKPSTTTSAPSDEFAQILVEARAASCILSETIKQENEVFLSFCSAVISQTLDASKSLNKMALNAVKESATESVAKAKENASKTVASAAKSAQNAIADNGSSENKKSASPKKAVSTRDKNSQNLADGFVDAMLMTMQNSVHMQQQNWVIAQAATTQTVTQILGLDSAALSVTVAKMIEGNK